MVFVFMAVSLSCNGKSIRAHVTLLKYFVKVIGLAYQNDHLVNIGDQIFITESRIEELIIMLFALNVVPYSNIKNAL